MSNFYSQRILIRRSPNPLHREESSTWDRRIQSHLTHPRSLSPNVGSGRLLPPPTILLEPDSKEAIMRDRHPRRLSLAPRDPFILKMAQQRMRLPRHPPLDRQQHRSQSRRPRAPNHPPPPHRPTIPPCSVPRNALPRNLPSNRRAALEQTTSIPRVAVHLALDETRPIQSPTFNHPRRRHSLAYPSLLQECFPRACRGVHRCADAVGIRILSPAYVPRVQSACRAAP